MVLFNIAKKNIEKNLKGYFLYFFSIVFTVCIYYTFKNLQYNPSIDAALSTSSKASTAFNSASIVIALFSVLFIWYSNNFFIKKRKKEIGLYALLGIENKEIGLLLFFETLIIGSVSILIGIIIGIIFSKFMLSILLKIIGLNLSIHFSVSIKGILDTFKLFILVFLAMAYQSNRIIYKFKLIDLFKASSISEKSKKESKLLAIISVILICIGYMIYFSVLKGMDLVQAAMITLALVVVGTFLFFSSFIYFVIRKDKNNKTKYYKGLNMIATSQLLYRVKSNAKMLSIISILSSTTLTAIGISMSTYFMSSKNVDSMAPFSYTLKVDNKDYIKSFEDILSKYSNHNLVDKAKFTSINLPAVKDNSNEVYIDEYEIISLSTLNQILKVKGDKEIESIKDSEFVHVYPTSESYYSKSIVDIDNKGVSTRLKLKYSLDKKLYNTPIPQNTIVVSDKTFANLSKGNKVSNYYLYDISNAKDSEKFNNEILKLTEKYAVGEYEQPFESLINSYYVVYKDMFTTAGIMVFIGVFVGLVFLVCTGSIIFFKLLSEAQDEEPRYKILDKIGVDISDVKASIYKQVGFNFLIPLFIGSVHSIVANYVVCKMFGQNIMFVMLCTLIPYSIIYIIYYMLTSKFYIEIVTKKV